jgi:hypothetical protein
MLGQLPVLVTLENGPINPVDPLTISPKVRGRAVKATGPARILGFATTHFPHVPGEKTRVDDSRGEDAVQLREPHVVCYLDVGWYEPAGSQEDGVEPPRQESAREVEKRIREEKRKRYESSEEYARERAARVERADDGEERE